MRERSRTVHRVWPKRRASCDQIISCSDRHLHLNAPLRRPLAINLQYHGFQVRKLRSGLMGQERAPRFQRGALEYLVHANNHRPAGLLLVLVLVLVFFILSVLGLRGRTAVRTTRFRQVKYFRKYMGHVIASF